jgi:uncharacterized protein (UPF0332 family)
MRPEQQALIRKAKESLVASQLLADNQLYNFAGARAYYTMFYIAEAFLWEKGLAFSSHSAVIAAFGKEIAKVGIVPVVFHRYLIDAQDKRSQGDYSIDEEVQLSPDDIQRLIEQSKQFIDLAEAIL